MSHQLLFFSCIQAYERLTIFDLEQFAKYAFERNDLQLASDMTKSILHLISTNISLTKGKNGTTRKRVQNLALKIARHNNAHLKKHECFLTKHHRMLPYLVDDKLLPKKNQPLYVRNDKIYDLRGNDFVGN